MLTESAALRFPRSLAVDLQGRPWVTDTDASGNSGVTVVSADGMATHFYATAPGPQAIAFDSGGNAWIPTSPGWVVDELSSTGSRLAEFPAPRDPGPIAFDSQGDAWVLGTMPPDLRAYGPGGTPLVLPTPSSVDNPAFNNNVGTSPSDLAIDSQGDVWVTEDFSAPDGAVRELNRGGDRLGNFPVDGNPRQIVFDAQGDAWIACGQSDTVVELSPSGKRLRTIQAGVSSSAPAAAASST